MRPEIRSEYCIARAFGPLPRLGRPLFSRGTESAQTRTGFSDGDPLNRLRNHFGWRQSAYALFLTAGVFKGDARMPALPLDLTVISALIVMIFVCAAIMYRQELPKAAFLVVLLFVSFVPPLMWTTWSAYAVEKTSRFFTLTFIAMLAPLFLIRTPNDLRKLFNAMCVVGVLMALDGTITYVQGGRVGTRLSGLGATTITTGLHIGMAYLWFLVLWMSGKIRTAISVPVLLALLTVLVATGSRGALVATVVASIAGLLHRRQHGGGRAYKAISILGVMVLGITLFPQMEGYLPAWSALRVRSFFTGSYGESALSRPELAKQAIEQTIANPWGAGFGGFETAYFVSETYRGFAHNSVLEAFCEGGVGAGFFLLGLLTRGLFRSWKTSLVDAAVEYRMLFVGLLCLTINSMVSGELNDDKVMLSYLACALGLPSRARIGSGLGRMLRLPRAQFEVSNSERNGKR